MGVVGWCPQRPRTLGVPRARGACLQGNRWLWRLGTLTRRLLVELKNAEVGVSSSAASTGASFRGKPGLRADRSRPPDHRRRGRSRNWRRAGRSSPCLRSPPFPTAQASFRPVVAAGSCGEAAASPRVPPRRRSGSAGSALVGCPRTPRIYEHPAYRLLACYSLSARTFRRPVGSCRATFRGIGWRLLDRPASRPTRACDSFPTPPTRASRRPKPISSHRPVRLSSGEPCCSYWPLRPLILRTAISVSGKGGGSRSRLADGPPSAFPAELKSQPAPTSCFVGRFRRLRFGAHPRRLGSGAGPSSCGAVRPRSSGRPTARGASRRT